MYRVDGVFITEATDSDRIMKLCTSARVPVVLVSRNISGGKLTEDTGLIEWEFDLEPAGTKTLALEYTVAWPKDKQINDLAPAPNAPRFNKHSE